MDASAAADPRPARESAPRRAAAERPLEAPSERALRAAAQQIESYLRSSGRALEFQIDTATGRTVIRVRDAHSGELVRQIPSEEVLRLARGLGESAPALIDLDV